jgi:hypothetical protein
MAMDYFSIPATSVPSEQAFSKASDLITKKRNRIDPSSAKRYMCLRYWLGLEEVTDDEVAGAETELEMRLAAAEARGRQAAAQAAQQGSPVDVDHSASLSSVED